ncbi:MAG: SDR family NAD(P)-dependent oxidoreductase [Deltaproteobacteria bacterium]|nr:SDR family NAD(P)-dependent oxidoreductase [Deltaproteobacteria bacterium]
MVAVDAANSTSVKAIFGSGPGKVSEAPDAFVHCIGGFRYSNLDELSDPDLDFLISANLRSTVIFLRELMPLMKKKNFGRIVLVSARATLQPTAGMSAYAATKAGLNALTLALADELKGFDININAVLPKWRLAARSGPKLVAFSRVECFDGGNHPFLVWLFEVEFHQIGLDDVVSGFSDLNRRLSRRMHFSGRDVDIELEQAYLDRLFPCSQHEYGVMDFPFSTEAFSGAAGLRNFNHGRSSEVVAYFLSTNANLEHRKRFVD